MNLDSLGAVEEETTLERSAPGDINYHGDSGDFTWMMLRMLMIGRDVEQWSMISAEDDDRNNFILHTWALIIMKDLDQDWGGFLMEWTWVCSSLLLTWPFQLACSTVWQQYSSNFFISNHSRRTNFMFLSPKSDSNCSRPQNPWLSPAVVGSGSRKCLHQNHLLR